MGAASTRIAKANDKNGDLKMEQYRVVSLIWGTFGLGVKAKDLSQAVRRAVETPRKIDLADTEFLEDYTEMIKEVYDIYVYDSNEKRIGDNYLEDGNIFHEHLGYKFFMKFFMLIGFGVLTFLLPLIGVIVGILLTGLVFFPKLIEMMPDGDEKEFSFDVTGFGGLALTFEAESAEKAIDIMKGVLNLTENEVQIPDEMNLYMIMNEITSLVQNTDDAENDKDLYSPIYKWYADLGLPSSWYFIPLGVALGIAINLLQ
jgi:hypothetical protein